MELFSAEILVSLLTLTFLEIVLGIDNVVFISIISGRLPANQQKKARLTGIALAFLGRVLLLLAINWIIGLNKPFFHINNFAFSYRDLILIVGGLFLIGKSTSEIHARIEGTSEGSANSKQLTLRSAILQILILDLVFSIDSIITAIGLVENVIVIIIAIVISLATMLFFAKRISDYINAHPAMKVLAISFLIMIGTVLVIEGFHIHVPKGYIYVSMAFALGVEILNIQISKRNKTKTPLTIKKMKFEEKKMIIGDMMVSYFDEGSRAAPTVLFIHGFPFNKNSWVRQLELLSDTHRVIAYDVRGHGHSEPGLLSFSIPQFVADLFLLLDALAIKKVTLCGLSMGGYIALAAHKQEPGRVVGLILCDTQCAADTKEVMVKRAETILAVEANGLQKYAVDSLEKLFSKNSLIDNPLVASDIEDVILHTPIKTITKTLMALARRSETCLSLNTIKVPVLIIVGADDQITPPEAAEKMHNLIPQSELRILEKAGHLSNLEAPETFNNYLQAFLGSLQNQSDHKGVSMF